MQSILTWIKSESLNVFYILTGILMLIFVAGFTDFMDWISKKLWNHPDR